MSAVPPATVPRLDLAPKRKRPLSLWNPLDYLVLLYWVFYFPQALRWYVETFATTPPYKGGNWREFWTMLRRDAVQRNLLVQGFLLTAVGSMVLAALLCAAGAPGWGIVVFSVAFGVVFGLLGSVLGGVVGGVIFGMRLGLSSSVLSSAMVGVVSGVEGNKAGGDPYLAYFVVLIGGFCPPLNVVFGFVLGEKGVPVDAAIEMIGPLLISDVMFSVVFGIMLGMVTSVTGGIVAGVALSVVLGAALLRPEAWLVGALAGLFRARAYPAATALPLPGLRRRLRTWLRADWETGVHNANELLAYTQQFIPVVGAVNDALAEVPPEEALAVVAVLAERPYDWSLLRFSSASLSMTLKESIVGGTRRFLLPWKQWQWRRAPPPIDLRRNTPARAAAGGFWLLHEKEPREAVVGFARRRALPYDEEMRWLAAALAAGAAAQDVAAIAALAGNEEFAAPVGAAPLRPTTWEALGRLRRAAQEAYAVRSSISRAARSLALNRAQGEVQAVLDGIASVPLAERALVAEVAQGWLTAFVQAAAAVGAVNIEKPVVNPYVVGDPVRGRLFVGREDILRKLEELWAGAARPASVVLYGHRRMGKTSILTNLGGRFGPRVHVAYASMLRVGPALQGAGDVLLAMADATVEALQRAGRPAPRPDDAAVLAHPYREFERYLRQVRDALGEEALVLVVDEFERIEELIRAGRIPPDFLSYLRGILQMDARIALALAGLHTLEEMTADYFEPLYASVIPIKVAFLSRAAVMELLANPDDDFLLDYDPEALERIWELTAGQPYLVQLVGHCLVSRYNDLVFEQQRPQANRFTAADVDAVVDGDEFYTLGRYYFSGVWGQAGQGPAGQQAVLAALASHPEGLAEAELGPDARPALEALRRHDVVREEGGRWRYAVELMRRWVEREKG